jgi:hypothetical protein
MRIEMSALKLLGYAYVTWSPWKWGACEVCGWVFKNGHAPDCGFVLWEAEARVLLGQAKGAE